MRPLGSLVLTILLAITASTAVPSVASAATLQASGSAVRETIYVDCSLHKSGNGSHKAPVSSLAEINGHHFGSGARVLFRRSTTCHGQLTPQGGGTRGKPAEIGAYGTGKKPTIAGGGTGSWTGAVQLTNQSYWTVRDLHVTNTSGGRSTQSYRSGVMILNTAGLKLRGITVENLSVDSVTSNMSSQWVGPRSFGGISVITQGGAGAGFSGTVVKNNTVTRVGRTGIVVSNNAYPAGADDHVRITGNAVSWTRGDGILLTGARDSRMDHNVSAHAAQEWPCEECGPITRFTANAAIWTGSSARVRIDHNEAYGTKTPGGDGEGFDVDSFAVDTVLEYNYSHDNEGGGMLFCGSKNAVARFNVLQNNLKSQFAFIGTAPQVNTTIENNTLYISKKSKAGIVRTFGGHIGASPTFKNNLIYSYGNGGYAWPSAPHTSGNTLVGINLRGRPTDATTDSRPPALKAPGTGAIGFASLGGYRLKKGAKPARRGTAIASATNHDFFGKAVTPRRPPRGAVG